MGDGIRIWRLCAACGVELAPCNKVSPRHVAYREKVASGLVCREWEVCHECHVTEQRDLFNDGRCPCPECEREFIEQQAAAAEWLEE